MGHERLSSGPRSHAPTEQLAGRAHRSKISLPLVLLRFYSVLSPVGMAWSANALIGFRILQGMSGGLMAPMAHMMIARIAGKHMARIIGYAAVPVMLGPIVGPVIAGANLQHASWRWLFLVNLPVGALAIVLAVLFLPNESWMWSDLSCSLPV